MAEYKLATYADVEREVINRIEEIRQRTEADNPDNEAIVNIFKAENAEFLFIHEEIFVQMGLEQMFEEIRDEMVASGELIKVGDEYFKKKPK